MEVSGNFQVEDLDFLEDGGRDGYIDAVDDLPSDAGEWWDTDGDGIGDNADPDPDNDQVLGNMDLFPMDATRWNTSSYLFVGENPQDLAGDVLARGECIQNMVVRRFLNVGRNCHHDIDGYFVDCSCMAV